MRSTQGSSGPNGFSWTSSAARASPFAPQMDVCLGVDAEAVFELYLSGVAG
jgi:hypothetical protein